MIATAGFVRDRSLDRDMGTNRASSSTLCSGFTLLEVLVALAIYATVAAVVLIAAGRSLSNASRLEEITFASWIADNRLAELQLTEPAPTAGRETQELEFAGRSWEVLSEIEASSDPGLLRATVWVAAMPPNSGGEPLQERATTTLTGFIAWR